MSHSADSPPGSFPGRTPIRPMAARDLDRVLSIAASLHDAPQWPRSAYESALAPGAVPRRISLVAESFAGDDAEMKAVKHVIGFALASLLHGQAELESIAVDRSVQGQGVGTALLAALIHELQLGGAESVLLEVRPSNLAALRTYQRAGFRQIGRRPAYYLNPREDALLLELDLRRTPLSRPLHSC